MSRSVWALVGALALATASGAGAASTARASQSAGARLSHDRRVASNSDRHGRRRSGGGGNLSRRQPGARAQLSARPVLALGSGYAPSLERRDVRWVQRRLHRLGLAPGPVDGRYGPLTERAVARFQAAAGLVIDGVIGRHTLAALLATSHAVLAPGAGYNQPAGSRRVRALQRRLRRLGFPTGPIDGRYGPLTMAAVRRFQRAHRLAATGVAARTTVALLRPAPIDHVRSRRTPAPPVTVPAISPPPVHLAPGLPVVPVLLALGLLGLGTMIRSYHQTRRQLVATPAAGRAEQGRPTSYRRLQIPTASEQDPAPAAAPTQQPQRGGATEPDLATAARDVQPSATRPGGDAAAEAERPASIDRPPRQMQEARRPRQLPETRQSQAGDRQAEPPAAPGNAFSAGRPKSASAQQGKPVPRTVSTVALAVMAAGYPALRRLRRRHEASSPVHRWPAPMRRRRVDLLHRRRSA